MATSVLEPGSEFSSFASMLRRTRSGADHLLDDQETRTLPRRNSDEHKQTLLDEEPIEEGVRKFKTPYDRPLSFRLAILACTSMLSFGPYFAGDTLSAYSAFIKEDLEISGAQFGAIGALGSLPNILFLLVSGFIIDKIGNRRATLIFGVVFTIGQCVVALAATVKSYPLILLGQLIYGLGAESSYIVRNNICVEWFQSWNHYALAMGITLTVARTGTIAAFGGQIPFANWTGNYIWGMWLGAILCLMSLLSGVLFLILDRKAKREFFEELGDNAEDIAEYEKTKSQERYECVNPRTFPLSYWLGAAVTVTIYAALSPFLSQAGPYIAKKFDISNEDANFWLTAIDFISLVLTPSLGFLVDWTSKRGWLVFLGNVFAVIGYTMLGFTPISPAFGVLVIGLHFSLMPAALWPTIPILLNKRSTAFGFAMVSSMINGMLTGVAPLVGYIGDQYGLSGVCLFCSLVALLSSILCLSWNLLDRFGTNPVINKKVV
eukprot:TRINITY_DN7755_c0_g1_i1.p1 TRINITY_DN7755_c0_g1~~TRINITY_DN7755_c0_g1_i1.p1  ORF type:complete len:491 (+),score=67.97 TRINITY_DN7755_c0_g1_i1:84-1556(+)